MKNLKHLITVVLCCMVGTLASAADSSGDTALLDRFENSLMDVMAMFEVAHDSSAGSDMRKMFNDALTDLQAQASALQKAIDPLNLGQDIAPVAHVGQVGSAFRMSSLNMLQQETRTSSPSKNSKLDNALSDKLSMTSGGGSMNFSERSGMIFRLLSNDVQALRELDFRMRSGRYSVSPQYTHILPYLEFKREYLNFRMNFSQIERLRDDRNWVNDQEKILIRMKSLAGKIQPVFHAYCPEESKSVSLSSCMTAFNTIFHDNSSLVLSSGTLGLETGLPSNGRNSTGIGVSVSENDLLFKTLSTSINNAQTGSKKDKNTTAAVRENKRDDSVKKAEAAFDDMLVFFEAMDKIDWRTCEFSSTPAKRASAKEAATSSKSKSSAPAKEKSSAADSGIVMDSSGDVKWE